MATERIPILLELDVNGRSVTVRSLSLGCPRHDVLPTKRQFKRDRTFTAISVLGLLQVVHDNSPYGCRVWPRLRGGRRTIVRALAGALASPTGGMKRVFGINQACSAVLARLFEVANPDPRDGTETEVWLRPGPDGRPLADFAIRVFSANGRSYRETDPDQLLQLARCLEGAVSGNKAPPGGPHEVTSEISLRKSLGTLLPQGVSVDAFPLERIADPDARASLIIAGPEHAARYFEARAGLFARSGQHRLAADANHLAAVLHATAGNLESRFACEVRRIPNLKAVDDRSGLRAAFTAARTALVCLQSGSLEWQHGWGRFMLEVGATLWIYGNMGAHAVLTRAQRLLPDWRTATPQNERSREAVVSACRAQRFLAEIEGMTDRQPALDTLREVSVRFNEVHDSPDVASCVASHIGIEHFHGKHSRVIEAFEKAEHARVFRIGSRWNELSGLSLLGSAYHCMKDTKCVDICRRALDGYREFNIAPSAAPALTRNHAMRPEATLTMRGRRTIAGPQHRQIGLLDPHEIETLLSTAPTSGHLPRRSR